MGAKLFLVSASLFFYAWWNVIYLPIILASLLFNYGIGKILDNSIQINLSKKTILFLGILSNLLVLGYFKYSDFFIKNIDTLLHMHIPMLHLALPLAISFFTFQQIAYLVDSYRGETSHYDFLTYALFVTFFPQLIAGPIVHHSEMMPQFSSRWNRVKKYKNITLGLFIFSLGLFKKVIIADTFAVWVKKGFDSTSYLEFFDAWVTSLSYTFQLYFDFSGYTDMAIGAALLFNIKLPINFNSPYKALDIQDFWKRWHITLSRFLKEYIYIPLGGNRKGSFRTYTNLLATFIIGGIWHGAGWTFIFWGFLHGMALVIHRFWKSLGLRLPSLVAWFITFNFINISWVFFRAKTWEDALKVLHGMFSYSHISLYNTFISIYNSIMKKLYFILPHIPNQSNQDLLFGFTAYLWIFVTFFLLLKFKNSCQLILENQYILRIRYTILFSFIFLYSIFSMSISTYTEFIYFNF